MADAVRDWPFEDAVESTDGRRVLTGRREADGEALCLVGRLSESGGVG